MTVNNKLAKILDSSCLGKLCMINFVDSVRCGSLDVNVAEKFLNTWSKNTNHLQSVEEIMGNMRVCKEADPNFKSKTGISLKLNSAYLYTVMPYENIRGHINFSAKKIKSGREVYYSSINTADGFYNEYLKSPPSDWKELESELKNIGKIEVKLSSNKKIKRSAKNIVWLSTEYPGKPLSEKICHKASGVSEADTARENLGMVHIQSSHDMHPPMLVALEIDASEVPDIWRPTQIDAENNSRFRGAYGDLRKTAINWGRTVHLKKLSDKNGELGAREGVALNFHPKNLRMWFLGYPRIPVNDGQSKDEKFVKNVARRRINSLSVAEPMSTIFQRFLSLCQ